MAIPICAGYDTLDGDDISLRLERRLGDSELNVTGRSLEPFWPKPFWAEADLPLGFPLDGRLK